MEESGPHKQSILRNKEVSLKNAPRKPRDVTRPTVMVKRLGFRGTLPVKYKIDFWNNPITASILVWNQVVLNQSQQLGYLNSKLMLSWDCPFKFAWFILSISSWKRWIKISQDEKMSWNLSSIDVTTDYHSSRPYNTGMAIRPNHLDRWRHRLQGWHHVIWSNNGVSRPCDKTFVKLSPQNWRKSTFHGFYARILTVVLPWYTVTSSDPAQKLNTLRE